MRSGLSYSVVGIGCGALALAGMVVLTASCASSGRAPPVTGPEAEALFTALTGTWVLDEHASSPPLLAPPDTEPTTSDSFVIIKGPGGSSQIIGDVGSRASSLAGRENALGRRPITLSLRADGERLVYAPTPGQSVTIPMNGAPATQMEGAHRLQTRVVWDGGRLALEHTVNPDDRIRVVMEVFDGQLRITRTIRIFGSADSLPPIVLVYGRDAGGG